MDEKKCCHDTLENLLDACIEYNDGNRKKALKMLRKSFGISRADNIVGEIFLHMGLSEGCSNPDNGPEFLYRNTPTEGGVNKEHGSPL